MENTVRSGILEPTGEQVDERWDFLPSAQAVVPCRGRGGPHTLGVAKCRSAQLDKEFR